MEKDAKDFSLIFLNGLKEKINTQSKYQRPKVWTEAQKQFFIDSILRGYDTPKIYLKKENAGNQFNFEIIDGHQRLNAIWEYFDGAFALPEDIKKIDDADCATKGYNDLDFNLQVKFSDYKIDVDIIIKAIQDDDIDEINELFLRLNNGTPLNAQEKLNAMPVKIRNFARSIAKHKFLKNCKFKKSKYVHDTIAAQLICLELSLEKTNEPCNIGTSDLEKIYTEQNNFDMEGKVAGRVIQNLTYLLKAFPNKEPELTEYSVITLYCLVSNLTKFYVYNGTEQQLYDWFIDFETERRENDELEDSKKDKDLVKYKDAITKDAEEQKNIQMRLTLMQESFFSVAPDILQKDKNRFFDAKQRLDIFRRDNEKCQICGIDIDWDNYEADHKTPHSKGGKTIISNGQALCKKCNGNKDDKI